MEPEYVIYESRLNFLNLEEMEFMFKDYYENHNPNKSTRNRKLKKLPKHISRRKEGGYVVIRTIDYKRHYLGTFYDLKLAKTTLNKFNVLHGLI